MTQSNDQDESPENNPGDWYDPRRGDAPFALTPIDISAGHWEPPRTNRFAVIQVESGGGTFWADAGQYPFWSGQLLFFVPYQYVRFEPTEPLSGTVIHFHANFLCVETFHSETGCSGLLFNDPYGSPAVALPAEARAEIDALVRRIRREQDEKPLAYEEIVLAAIKMLLILATRCKATPRNAGVCEPAGEAGADPFRDPTIQQLTQLIEQHYQRLHAPADYAELLGMTTKTLGRQVRQQLGKTLGELIRQRVLTHAKWQLLHTLKPVKQVAAEVGYHEELYFSRLFKKATGVSPKFFREFETEIRGGSNLSMD
ncbi:MAG: AraC family transcriptional regulator [Pirellulaceae bacterium]